MPLVVLRALSPGPLLTEIEVLLDALKFGGG